MPLRLLIALTLALCALPAVAAEPTGTLTGVVRAQVTQKPIANAHVSCGAYTAQADEKGEFVLEDIPAGVYSVSANAPGYGGRLITDVQVSSGRVARILLELHPDEPDVTQLESVHVQASPFTGSSRAATSAVRLNRFEMQRTVGAAWDIQRVFGSQPGATTSSDLTNNLVVRGGNPTENLIRVDDIEALSISHIAAQGESGGAIGLVNLDFVRDTEFFTGGFPAEYGGKLSSVLDIRLREGNRERLGGEIELSMAGFGGGLEGPLQGGRGSWVASYRQSFLDLLKEPARLTAIPHYDDAHAKVVLDLSDSHRLSWVGIGGRSDVDIQWVRNVDRAVYDGFKLLTGGTWSAIWGESAASRVTLSHVASVDDSQIWQAKPEPIYDSHSASRETAVAGALDIGADENNAWRLGAELRRIEFRYRIGSEDWNGFSENAGRIVYIEEHEVDVRHVGWRLSGYAHRDWTPVRPLSVRLGVRGQRFTLTDASSVDPRIGLRWTVAPQTSLSLSGGIYHQSPTTLELVLDPTNLELQDFEAWHAVAGFERRFAGASRLLIEAYRKEYRDLPIREDETLAGSNALRNLGRKQVQGVDLLLEKRIRKGPYGSIILSLSDSKSRDAQGAWYPDDYDIRRLVSVSGGVPLIAGWTLGGKWRLVGGRPYTLLPIRPNDVGGYDLDPDFEARNTVRYPDYRRLDLRIDRRLELGGWGVSLFLEVQNVTNRDNVYAWQFDRVDGELKPILQFQRLTIMGIIADF